MSILTTDTFNVKNITFSDVKTDIHGRKMVFLNHKGGKIQLQLPKMYSPFGIKKWRKADDNTNKDDKFEMELSFKGTQNTDKNGQKIKKLHESLLELDELIKEKCIENCKSWIGVNKIDKSTFEEMMYKPNVRVSKDKDGNVLDYPDRFRVKIDRDIDQNGNPSGKLLSCKKNKTSIIVVDNDNNQTLLTEDNAEKIISRNSQVITIVQLVYLSLSKTAVSTKWKLIQAKVYPDAKPITNVVIVDEDEDEDDNVNENDSENVDQQLMDDLDNLEITDNCTDDNVIEKQEVQEEDEDQQEEQDDVQVIEQVIEEKPKGRRSKKQ